jgi:transposase-like protein
MARYCGRRLWCKQAVIGDDDRMQPFVPVEVLFKGRHFDGQIIILCVSWYTSFKLSLRDLVIMMADRGITQTRTTILRWVYLYQAVDKAGRTVDFLLSENRDMNAAKTFLRRAIEKTRKPTKITLDAHAASHRGAGN